jgi:hypothetical protein
VTGEILDAAPDFSDFWLLYPRRVARKDAITAWMKLTPNQQIQAVVAMVDWRRVWAKKDLDYVPHAATWLNGWRFEDELPVDPTVSCSAHVAADIPEQTARTSMPEHVKALLAKLRGK